MYNFGLISLGAEDVASESPENRPFRLPHCHLTSRLQGNPANIRINLINYNYCQKLLQSLRYTFAAECGSIFTEIVVLGSENACILKQSAKWPFKVIHGH